MVTAITVIFYVMAYISLFTSVLYFMSFIIENKKLKAPPWKGPLPIVSIIIPAYNEEKSIAKTIESVLGLDYPKNKLDIIIIDDGSKDNTLKEASKYKKFIRIFTKINGGKASAVNLGIKNAKGEFIITMDADSFVNSDALTNMLGYFQEKDVACVTASMLIKNPKGFWLRMQAVEYAFGVFLRKAFSLLDAVHVTPGPFSAYRKSFFDKYGGFSEKTITEDTEMALRIQSHGYKIRTSLNSIVYTIGPNNFKDLFYQRRRWYTGFLENVVKYKKIFSLKHGELGIIILPSALISIAFSFVLTIYSLKLAITNSLDLLRFEQSVGFDIFGNIHPSSFLIQKIMITLFTSPIFLFGLLGNIAFIVAFIIVKRYTKQKLHIILGFFFFILFYIIFFSFWWAISIVNTIFLKNRQWRKE
jgi:cellulose synthase/poly-beta-1,6-N-acetylglucosamine synthase-like glycosyltransferase